MTLDEKLSNFYNSVINDANSKSTNMLDEYRTTLETIFEEHKQDAMRKTALTLRIEKENIIREKNKALSSETLMIKRNLSEKVNSLVDQLFNDVLQTLENFKKTSAYTDLLVKQIKEAMSFAREEQITIYIDPDDEPKKAELELMTDATLSVSTYSFLGGTRAVIPAKNILIDNSFSTNMEEVRESFTLDSHLKHAVKHN